ncbi:MAG: uroporphyrinogen-III synthase [Actinomycetes bacterium]
MKPIAVVRPKASADRSCAALIAAGLEALPVALTAQVHPPDGGLALATALDGLDSHGDLDGPGLITLASAEGARRFLAALNGRTLRPGVILAVVGPSTEAVLVNAGLSVDLLERVAGGAALAEQIAAPKASSKALVIAALEGRRDLAEGLAAKGWQVEAVAAYATVPIQPSSAELEVLANADLIVVAAPSSLREIAALVAATDGAGRARRVVAIGSTTAKEAIVLGFDLAGVAAEPNDAGVIAAIKAILEI